MTFDVHELVTGIDGVRREILVVGQFGDAAPSLAVTAGEAAA
ncbi:hypothetical protein [Microterricola viridarii]|nr:hypothetical protein [Microterricola viridarii]